MKPHLILSLLVAVFLFNSCAPNTISFYLEDESKVNFNSYSFYARDVNNLKPQQRQLDSLIELTISNELTKKGFEKKSSSDVYLNYKISIGTSSSASIERQRYNNTVYFPEQQVNTSHYKEGVLLVEIYSNEDNLLWQGSKKFKVGKSSNTPLLLLEYAEEIMHSFKSNL